LRINNGNRILGYETKVGERGLRLSGGEKVKYESRNTKGERIADIYYAATCRYCQNYPQGSTNYLVG
jgi:hypothetical protein